MFKQDDNQKTNVETIIGPSVTVEGTFMGNGDVAVEGAVHGSMKTDGTIRVGSNAKVKAEVSASRVLVAGEIRGNIKAAEQIKLSPTAKVFGNMETSNLEIESGAVFQGKSIMVKNDPSEKLFDSKKNSNKPKAE